MLTAAVLIVFALAFAAPWLHRRVPPRALGWILAIAPAALALQFLLPPYAAVRLEAYEWVPGLGVRLSFALDGLARLFAVLITGIGALVVAYAGAYMAGDPRLGRLYAYLFGFMGAMLGIVLADNVLALFVFWELTSITSFLLIGFDQHRAESRASALQALLVTGGGGLALFAGLLLLGQAGGSLELSVLAGRGEVVRASELYVPVLLLVLLGAFTKSAQAPFHFWLPNAMAAPTPVSAYLHSSTMVKAGVYLLARLSPALGGTVLWQYGLGAVGGVTMVLGASLALAQTDLKRILAYSTVSALGVMTLFLGVGGPAAVTAAIVFLFAHALYKGALFLVAGSLTHATHERDVTRLSGLRGAMPITAVTALLAALSMAGVPLLVGFVGKELTLEAAWQTPGTGWIIFTAATVLTSILLVAVALVVGLRPFVGAASHPDAHEGPLALWFGPAVLVTLGLATGILPGLIDPLVAAAASRVTWTDVPVHLVLWHGWTAPLGFGLLALGLGVVLFRGAAVGRAQLQRLAVPGADVWYQHALDGVYRAARLQTDLLQTGVLRHYLLIVVSTAVVLTGLAFLRGLPMGVPVLTEVQPHEAVIAAAIVLGSVAVVLIRSRLGAVAALGTVGFGVALMFAMFGAPDLAMTQFVIEALLVVLFVLVFYNMPTGGPESSWAMRLRDLVVASSIGLLMMVLVLVAVSVQVEPPVSGYFLERAAPDAHGRNVVNVILVDFRAMDTLGEISVLAVAAVGVYALLHLRPAREWR